MKKGMTDTNQYGKTVQKQKAESAIQKKVIIDTDPSADDAIALMLALASPELQVLGMTAAYGVCDSDRSIRNIMKIQELCERPEIPAVKGAKAPLSRPMEFDDAYCGPDGLSCTGLSEPEKSPEKTEAFRWMGDMIKAHPGEVFIISMAPMTNLALMLQNAPETAGLTAGIFTISGGYGLNPDHGRLNPRPEWNIAQDPEAASAVFSSGIPITAAGLDVTSRLEDSMMDRLLSEAGEGKKTDFLRQAVQFNLEHGLNPSSLLVDSAAVALTAFPDMAKTARGGVLVETKGEYTTGQTLFGNSGRFKALPQNVSAAWEYDWNRLIRLLTERVFI